MRAHRGPTGGLRFYREDIQHNSIYVLELDPSWWSVALAQYTLDLSVNLEFQHSSNSFTLGKYLTMPRIAKFNPLLQEHDEDK
jgi:hypothetical protein